MVCDDRHERHSQMLTGRVGKRGVRYYGGGFMREETRENKKQCIVHVAGLWAHQCTRKRGHGPKREYCWQHAKTLKRYREIVGR